MTPLTTTRPMIGLTMGDPAGIGPEILIKALSDPNITDICRCVVLGDLTILEKAVRLTGRTVFLNTIDTPFDYLDKAGQINLMCLSNLDEKASTCVPPTPGTGKAAETYILKGTDLAIAGEIDAIVTGPITKTGLKAAGSQFHGHTELIAHRTGTQKFGMMMAGSRLKVVLVTIHMPLAQVIKALTPDRILEMIDLTHSTMVNRFGVPSPRLAVAGLNPHAGEGGMFGDEETSTIMPAVTQALEKGYDVQGPLPPDTVFFNAFQGQFDAVICMYHDQGLIPFKMTHFKDGVNTTIGLPIIRTSVDHGTAYDIAWQNKADETSLKEAIKMAVYQAVHRHRGAPHAQ
ncbi:MAG: 4-hydroxythreonine-4-phosphate dehydrogenase PdxA [Desulfobacterales bacterium]|nr:MAG: 4-hydroxythreonine-4-phosphate dehydrogenase PdxA [Desulfobacterales bacterium]